MSDLNHTPAQWVAVDWGTSHLRLWPMGADGVPHCRIDSDKGMSRLTPAEYEQTLLNLLEPYLTSDGEVTVVCCGMAGSRQGWAEAPYMATPCRPPSFETATRVATGDKRLRVHILSGVKQPEPADVMRGEETQIAGVFATHSKLDGVICLPGTHTKWVSVQKGSITGFSTFMSGELFQLVSDHSVLRHTLAHEGWDDQAFDAGCRDGAARPDHLANALFGLRAAALLNDLDPVAARARASGYLLGMEVAAMRDAWRGSPVVVVGDNAIAQAYATALKIGGATVEIFEAEKATLAGLSAARAQVK
ncbi:2-dehydro-3-deoxygalactonokinase [Tritonibacter scottomollicae]|uniref:2-dehydro-3-deoxygalactonokinase n=1 Tax=Tritonibacter scottomollicae TaxID=483013 RepID=UPI003AA7B0B3